jgi:hypothetical protein
MSEAKFGMGGSIGQRRPDYAPLHAGYLPDLMEVALTTRHCERSEAIQKAA